VHRNEAYLIIILLSRVITKLGDLKDVNPGVIENLFSADLAYLQDFYRRINTNGNSLVKVICPKCENEFEMNESALNGGQDMGG
jgi:hypothetical protein